jgi:hypothetical protein
MCGKMAKRELNEAGGDVAWVGSFLCISDGGRSVPDPISLKNNLPVKYIAEIHHIIPLLFC